MNKLVSKNPVLRFKQGKKITKALEGLNLTYHGLKVKRLKDRYMVWNPSVKAFDANVTIPLNGIDTKVGIGNAQGHVYRGSDNNWYQNGKMVINSSINPSTLGTSIRTVTVTPRTSKPSVAPTYYATRAYRGRALPEGLNSRAAVKAYLLKIGMTGEDLDGIWGDNTLAAYEKYINNINNLLHTSNYFVNIPTAPAASVQRRLGKPYGSYWDNTMLLGDDDPKFLRNNLRIKPELRTSPITYDRSGTRDWIRNNLGRGAYEYTGAQRRALRYWLNGDKDGLNYDKNLLGVFGNLSLYAKQGAKLVSRNPVERFKTKLWHLNFKLSRTTTALKNGGNIPKLLTGWTPLLWNKPNDTFTQTIISRVGNLANEAENRAKHVKKVTRDTRIPEDVAGLLDLLWLSGAFKGVIDKKTGKLITYERAVDGKMGSMTLLAIENDRKKREATPLSPRTSNNSELRRGGLAAMREMTNAARTGGMSQYNPGPVDPGSTMLAPIRAIAEPYYSSNIPFATAAMDLGVSTINKLYRKGFGKGKEDFIVKNPNIYDIPTNLRNILIDFYKDKWKKTGQEPTSWSSGDWREFQGTYTGGNRRIIDRAFTLDPIMDLEHSLGQWNYYKDNNGNVHAIDVYDWNDGETSHNLGNYTKARDFMGKYGTRASETSAQETKHGRHNHAARRMDINLGKITL